jgi:glycosyltransferase involved in cell wall biosynthesis
MKICFITKYPPIQGGVSSRAYWQAKALGERGHEVHIITNSLEVEDDYKEVFDFNDPDFLPINVFLHSTDADSNPWHIPFSPAYTERLANLAIEVIQKYDCQVIDSNYILPYSIAGNIAKNITGVPQILRHAGSDIGKLYKSDSYNTLFRSIFHRVDKILTYPQLKEMFISLGIPESKIGVDDKVIVDPNALNPGVTSFPLSSRIEKKIPECPILTYIGKINYYWESKGLPELVKAVKDIKEDFLLLFVANGKGIKAFQKLLEEEGLMNRSLFLDFLPPWQIPSVIKLSTCVVVPERDFPIPYHIPISPKEVMAVGKCLVLGKEIAYNHYYGNLVDKENVLLIDPKNIAGFKSTIEFILRNPEKVAEIGRKAYETSRTVDNFNEFIDYTLVQYNSLLHYKKKKLKNGQI